jgi:hypothetical protein
VDGGPAIILLDLTLFSHFHEVKSSVFSQKSLTVGTEWGLRDLLTQKFMDKKTVTDFKYPRACRFRKYQIENKSLELK